VVVANYGTPTDPGGVSVLLNTGDGTGTLQPAQNFAAGSRPTSVAVADVDGDGLNDVLTSNSAGNNASVLLQIPPGPAPSTRPGSGGAVAQVQGHSAVGAEGRADPLAGLTAAGLGLHRQSDQATDGSAAQPDTSSHHVAVQEGLFADPVLGGLPRRDVV
jgi:hypothetical protein